MNATASGRARFCASLAVSFPEAIAAISGRRRGGAGGRAASSRGRATNTRVAMAVPGMVVGRHGWRACRMLTASLLKEGCPHGQYSNHGQIDKE